MAMPGLRSKAKGVVNQIGITPKDKLLKGTDAPVVGYKVVLLDSCLGGWVSSVRDFKDPNFNQQRQCKDQKP